MPELQEILGHNLKQLEGVELVRGSSVVPSASGNLTYLCCIRYCVQLYDNPWTNINVIVTLSLRKSMSVHTRALSHVSSLLRHAMYTELVQLPSQDAAEARVLPSFMSRPVFMSLANPSPNIRSTYRIFSSSTMALSTLQCLKSAHSPPCFRKDDQNSKTRTYRQDSFSSTLPCTS